MRTFIYFIAIFTTSICFLPSLSAQTTREASVLVNATVAKRPTPRITLQWRNEARSEYYLIGRKLRGENAFQQLDSVPGSSDTWVDSSVQ
ncbi:MAG: hypothetical protein AB7H80_08860, partial [Candidatus Kapaibacterium sp.]